MTFMNKSPIRTFIPAVVGRLVVSAYMFHNEDDAHGVVLTFDDGSDVCVEFNYGMRVAAEVFQCKGEDGEPISLHAGEWDSAKSG